MVGKSLCKGCGVPVAKLITCADCGTVSHPSCLHRTGHLYSGGQFTACGKNDDSSLALNDSMDSNQEDLLRKLSELIKSEFSKFRSEMMEMYRADLAMVTNDFKI